MNDAIEEVHDTYPAMATRSFDHGLDGLSRICTVPLVLCIPSPQDSIPDDIGKLLGTVGLILFQTKISSRGPRKALLYFSKADACLWELPKLPTGSSTQGSKLTICYGRPFRRRQLEPTT